MLPAILDTDSLTTAFFMPVHFQDQCFGYIALEVEDSIDDFNMDYIRYCREVNNALKFLCTQNELKRLLNREKIARSRDDLTGLYLFHNSKEMWTEIQDHANLYQEQLYLIVIAAGGLRHIENAGGSVESDRYLASFADILAKCCNSKEKIFQLVFKEEIQGSCCNSSFLTYISYGSLHISLLGELLHSTFKKLLFCFLFIIHDAHPLSD
jgi:hypothetical protein